MTLHGFTGAELIAVERARQILPKGSGGEGWDAEHDRGHADSLAAAGARYALPEQRRVYSFAFGAITGKIDIGSVIWSWERRWWKPSPDDRVKELVKAGALIAAAIDAELAK